MGVSVSKNTINSLVENTNSIIQSYENICTVTGNTAAAQFTANNCKFTNTTVDIEATQNVTQSCIQNNNTMNSMNSAVELSMRQTASAITQQFGFPSAAIAQ